ncbi:Flp pilus assembly protein CpaB [Caldilinea sp.]|uniref:Flp pilus assembly protein CpaB n=1 Tax=Caldilinea sp. TaxID=2293560 RepID=UPI002BCBEB2A|nr:Flp pilus assembly protein CpaB [Anaerolineales bacterium]HQY91289.1 Flp pilus assembly protein CpaB [Caldilinea sp.]HRA65238.1 Flp pilus assembly protein CpaB [Caldilinea sp.]
MSRMRGFIWFLAGIILALLAGFVAYSSLTRVVETAPETTMSGPTVTVVAANRALPARTLLTQEDLTLVELPASAAPDGQIDALDAAVGKLTLLPLYGGEPVLEQKLVDPNVLGADGRSAIFLNQDQVLMAIPAQDLLSRVGVLKPGDRVDILYSLSFPENRGIGAAAENEDEAQSTFALLQNVTIVEMIGSIRPVETDTAEAAAQTAPAVVRPDSVLVTLAPQDALTLKYAMDAGGIVDFVMRAPGVERPFDIDPVDVDYLINRYSIPTGAGR